MKCSYSVKFYNKIQSLPRLTLHLRNMECDSVARDALVRGVFIALVADIFCVNVAASTLSGVWMAGRDEEMAEGTDIKGWLDEPAKSWAEILKNSFTTIVSTVCPSRKKVHSKCLSD